MGGGAEDTLASTGISSEDRKKYEAAKPAMANLTHFYVKKMLFLSTFISIIEDKERTNQLNSVL